MKYLVNIGWLAIAVLPGLVNAAEHACSHPALSPINPTSAYTIHDDGTVTDPRTGLMWKRCGEGQTFDPASSRCTGELLSFDTWPVALNEAAKRSSYAGHDDWRLPNAKELYSLVELCKSKDSLRINTTVFPYQDATPDGASIRVRNWWSSSPGRQTQFAVLGGEPALGVWILHQENVNLEITRYDQSGSGVPHSIRLVRSVVPK